jgi:hypothetical protein
MHGHFSSFADHHVRFVIDSISAWDRCASAPASNHTMSHVTNAAEFSRDIGDLPDIVAFLRLCQ